MKRFLPSKAAVETSTLSFIVLYSVCSSSSSVRAVACTVGVVYRRADVDELSFGCALRSRKDIRPISFLAARIPFRTLRTYDTSNHKSHSTPLPSSPFQSSSLVDTAKYSLHPHREHNVNFDLLNRPPLTWPPSSIHHGAPSLLPHPSTNRK